jgi:hypothetical protein
MWAAPRMVQDQDHAGCGPHVRLNDWLAGGGCGTKPTPQQTPLKRMWPKTGDPERALEATPTVRSWPAEAGELEVRAMLPKLATEAEETGMRDAAVRASDERSEANAAIATTPIREPKGNMRILAELPAPAKARTGPA